MSRRGAWGILAVLVLLPGTSPGVDAQTADCSARGQTAFVHDVMHDLYYWYREVPAADPGLFASPEAYLEAVRYRPRDTSFSYIAPREASDAFYSDSQFVGLGLGTRLVSPTELRVTQAFPDSPAAEAGIERGDTVLAIGGREIADLYASGALDSAFGPSQPGVAVTLRVRARAGGGEREMTLVKRLVTIPTVSDTRVFDLGGRRVGYVHLRNFVRPSSAALDSAFRMLAAAGAGDLVLDLRYNGGGLVSVAQHLGGLIGGVRTNTRLFTEFFHNDRNTWRNEVLRFEDPSEALDLPRLVVLTTRASASASELVINALRPFLPVTIVGGTTFGKPVGQYGLNFCDQVFYPVAFTLRNARGEGDYFDGFAPDCAAGDDLEHALGDAAETMLGEALHFLRTGACSASARALQRLGRPEEPRAAAGGWQALVGAY